MISLGVAQVSFLYRSTDIYPKEIANNISVEDIPLSTHGSAIPGYDHWGHRNRSRVPLFCG